MDAFFSSLEHVLGLNADTLGWWQLLLRAMLIYGVGLALVRIGKRRFMGTYTAFDVILGITIGALLASAAADSSLFINAIGLVFALVVLHWGLAFITYKWEAIGTLLLGQAEPIIEDGQLNEEASRSKRLSHLDIKQALRKAGVNNIEDVHSAHLERNGELSIVPRGGASEGEQREGERVQGDKPRGGNGQASAPRVVEVEVRDGVQKVIVELR